MKANRKFVEGEEAVSAVIGVILMVAITVAIAAAVYVYVSGMIGGTTQHTPSISCTVDNANDKIVVASAETGLTWNDIKITWSGGTSSTNVKVYRAADTSSAIGSGSGATGSISSISDTNQVSAADYIEVTDDNNDPSVTVTIIYEPTNTIIGTYTITA